MKKCYKNAMLSTVFCLGFLCTNAQEKKKNVDAPSRGLIMIDNAVQAKNSQSIFQKYVNLGEGNSYKSIETKTDNIGIRHQKFQQIYKGIPVEFGQASINSIAGKASSINGEYYKVRNVDLTPKLSKEQAFQKAIAHIGAQKYLWDDLEASKAMNYSKLATGQLLILPDHDSENGNGVVTKFNLAYKFDIYATQPLSRGDLYIDAKTGEPLFYNATIKHLGEHSNTTKNLKTISATNNANFDAFVTASLATGTAATRYSGNKSITTRTISGNFTLRDNTRGGGVNTYNSGRNNSYPTTNFTDNDNNWTAGEFNNANKDNAALDAHWGAEVTYDYWSTVHSRNSFNGSGAAINSWVHYDDQPGGAGYDNAFWNGSVMTYGDGSSNGNEGNGGFDALTSLDVAAHEIGHAITTFTANLAYRRESGGLNEGFSDIWGAAVEHYAKGNGNDAAPSNEVWLIGDEIDRRTGSAALRSMSDPKSLRQPDTYRGTNWRPATVAEGCANPTRQNDQCGVHTNSGVLNYWFYLVTAGSANTDEVNDNGDAFTVAGIGMTKAAKIAYRTLNVYLSANSTYADARAGAIQAAKDLYTAGGAEEQAVTNAWYAVGVGAAFSGGGGNPPGNACASSISTFPYTQGFENTLGEWKQETTGDDIDWTINTNGTPSNNTGPGSANQGTYYVYVEASGNGTGFPNKRAILNSPCFDLSGVTQANFKFDYHMYGDPDMGSIAVEASTDQGVTWTSIWSQTGNKGNNWLNADINLNAYAGTTVQLRFNRVTGSTWQADIAIDNASVTTGISTPTDTQAPSAPTGLTASAVTETTLTLSWAAATDNVGVTAYDIYQGATNLGSVNATTANVTGLTASTAYQFSVKAKDAAGNESASSNTVNVTTSGGTGAACTSGISTFPYNEGLENTLGEWTQETAGDDINWTLDANGTPSRNTGPSSATQGTYYIFVEASGNGTGFPNKRAILNSPCFDLTGLTQASFNFNYHMFGANDMGSITVEASTDEGANWTSIWSQTGNKGNSWQTANINLAAYVGGGVKLRFNRVTGATWQADIAIDNVSITTGAALTSIVPTTVEIESSTNFRVYPNPTSSILNIVGKDQGNTLYTIYNMLGQTVRKGTFTNAIDVQELKSGFYVLQVNEKTIQFFKE